MPTNAFRKALLVTTLSLAGAFCTVTPAHAEPTAPAEPTESSQLAIMDRELALFAEQAKAQRTALKITGTLSGAALLPAGIVLAQRSDPFAHSSGIGMEIGGAVTLALTLTAWIPSDMERVRGEFESRRASGVETGTLLRDMETRWERAAEAGHTRRIVIGIVDLSLGVAATGAGLFFLLSDPVAKLDRNDQYTLGNSLVGPGVPLMANGIRMLVQDSIEETSWRAYQATKPIPQGSQNTGFSGFGVAPLRGGAAAVATYTF